MPDQDHALYKKYHARIQEIHPELEVEKVRVNTEGLINDVILVNDSVVFRFAKTEAGERILARELAVLETVRQHVSIRVTDPFYTAEDAIAYELIPGEALTLKILQSLDERDRTALEAQLGQFLKELHSVRDEDLPVSTAPNTHAIWLKIQGEVLEHVYPLLMKHQREWADDLFENMLDDPANFDYQPSLTHGDLGCYHILYHPEKKTLSGILDFGVSGTGDPATDIGNLLTYYGESFVGHMLADYPVDQATLKRARFYAQAIELDWVSLGRQTDEIFWFAAHLGNRRELHL